MTGLPDSLTFKINPYKSVHINPTFTGEEFIVSYLPAGTWCNWVDGSCYQGPTEVKVISSNSPASFTFLKGGTAVVTQNSANTTTASREEKVGGSCRAENDFTPLV